MLKLSSQLMRALIDQANKDHPLETCGLIVGPMGSDCPERLIPMRNAAMAEDFFLFDAKEQLRVWREMEARNEEPIVIYHSHTKSRAYPSPDDVGLACEPASHYVLISTAPDAGPEVRSFRIADGVVVEEAIKTVQV